MRPAAALSTVDGMTGMDARDTDLKRELDATLHARRDLGEEYESAGVGPVREYVDPRIVGAGGRRGGPPPPAPPKQAARDSRSPRVTDSWGERFGFGIVSLVLAVPLSAIGAGTARLPGLLVAWAGIVGVNLVQALRADPNLFGRRRRSSQDGDWED